MRTYSAAAAVLIALASSPSHGSCEITPKEYLPEQGRLEAWTRNRLYRSACEKSAAGLVDLEDARLKPRLGQVPSDAKPELDTAFRYPTYGYLTRAAGLVVLAIVVEADGEIVPVGVLKSSGNGYLDEAAMKGAARAGRIAPYCLDGVAVRAFRTWAIRFAPKPLAHDA